MGWEKCEHTAGPGNRGSCALHTCTSDGEVFLMTWRAQQRDIGSMKQVA